MVEKLPSPHTYLLLGDAYMNIQEVSTQLHAVYLWPPSDQGVQSRKEGLNLM